MDDGLYLYCAVPAGHAPAEALRGVDDALVRAFPAAGLALWASPMPHPPAAAIASIERHNQVVEAAMTEAVTPVPLRFGQFVATVSALFEKAAERAAEWQAQLAAFASSAEYGVRVLDPSIEPAARDVRAGASSGRAYMEALARAAGDERQRRDRAERIAAALHARAGGFIRLQRVEPLPSAHGIASIAHLVRHDDTAAYRAALDEARADLPALRFLSSGPWPPYSFAR